MTQLNLSVLGAVLVEVNGVFVEFATRKAAALLIYLAVTNQPQRRDTLATLLWPESDPTRARASLRRALAHVKKGIGGDWVFADRELVKLNEAANIQVDIHQFHALIADEGDKINAYSQAVALYRDDFLAGFTLKNCSGFDEWQFFEQESLRQSLSNVLETLIKLHQEKGTYRTAISFSRHYVALDPLNETAQKQLMYLYAQNGQQTAALRQYELCKQQLEKDLGVEPDPLTTTLYHQIKSQRPMVTSQPHPLPHFATTGETVDRHNLPSNLTTFVGREQELLQIGALLDDPGVRLLTLVGIGGVGKTRLALQAIAQQRERFPDGVWYIDLIPIQTIEDALTTVANVLDLTFRGSDTPQEQLVAYIKEKKMLLLLDNFEHLVNDATVISNLLQEVAGLKIITTSREMLDLAEEWLYQVEGLSYPSINVGSKQADEPQLNQLSAFVERQQFTAVQLFTQRARQARHTFSLTQEKADVVHICQMVEGMPLALELAASWVRLLPCQQIASEIQQSLDFLTTTQHNISDRHRSVRAVFEYSWQMLSLQEQLALAQLSVFRGQFTIEAAQSVANASLFVLYSLLNKSLLSRRGENYYELHELLRQFTSQKLMQMDSASDDVSERHMTYYTNLLHHHEETLFGADQTKTLDQIGDEIENIYQAWLLAAKNGRFSALNQSFHSLYNYHAMRSQYHQGEQLFHQTISLLEPFLDITTKQTNILLTRLLSRQGEYQYILGKMGQAEDSLRYALSLAQQMQLEDEIELATQILGVVSYLQGQFAEAKSLLNQVLQTAVAHKNNHRQAYTLMSLGAIEQALGNYTQAQKLHQTSLDIYQNLEYEWGIAYSLRFLGITAFHFTHYTQAQQYYQKSLKIFQKLHNDTGIALALNNLGMVAQALGNPLEARSNYEKSLISSNKSHDLRAQATALQNLGHVAVFLDEPAKKGPYLQQALAIASKTESASLILDILLDLGLYLGEGGDKEQAALIITMVHQHPSTNWETKTKAEARQPQLVAQKYAQLNVGQESSNLQTIIKKLINPATIL